MPRLLAIDCDARELCFVLGNSVGERVTLEAAGSVSLKGLADDRPLQNDELGKQLQALLAKHKRSGAKVLASVDRNAIELFQLTVPPAADAELPELVMNQLAIESSNIANESVIDFIPDVGGASEPRRITAAALSQVEFDRVKTVCTAAGYAPDCMLVRPYETASLFLKQQTAIRGNSLLVNVVADEVDLIVVDQQQPLFFRTVRLPAGMGDEAAEQRLLDEIRRTLLVAPQGSEVGQVIDAVYVFGTSGEYERIVQQISKDSTAKVELLDPYVGFALGSQWEKQTSGRLIPLLGMLLGEAHGGNHAIDFLHPRRAPKPPDRKRQLAMALIVAAVLVGTGGYYVWDLFSAADAVNKKLASDLADLEALVKKSSKKEKVTEAIDDWNGNSVVWLDELRELSSKFPSGQDLVIQRLSMTPTRGGKASIAFQGLAREPKVVTRMEVTLRDSRHEVQTPRVEERVQDKLYSWGFETSVSLSPAKVEMEESDHDQSASEVKESGKKESNSKEPDKQEASAKESAEPAVSKSKKPRKGAKTGSKKATATEEPAAKEASPTVEPNSDDRSQQESPSVDTPEK